MAVVLKLFWAEQEAFVFRVVRQSDSVQKKGL